MKFRAKPVVIEAIQWTGENLEEIGELLGRPLAERQRNEPIMLDDPGEAICEIGDWIVKGVMGDFYVYETGTFEMYYARI